MSEIQHQTATHSKPRFTCGIGFFKGLERIGTDEFRQIRTTIPCNTWNCEYCRKKKAKRFAKRALTGGIGNYEGQQGFRSRYEAKMFTFTCPGSDYRKRLENNPHTHGYTGEVDPESAYRAMCDQFDKLIRAMRKSQGDFMYLRCVEPQRDGYPHFHVLFVGKCIIPRSIYGYVKGLWEDKYGQGFAWVSGVKNKSGKTVPFRSVKHAVNYCMKYLKKAPGKFSKMSRPITSCKKALSPPPPKKIWFGYAFKPRSLFGDCQDNGFESIELEFHDPLALEEYLYKEELLFRPKKLFTTDYEKPVSSLLKQAQNLQECLDFFDEIIESHKPKQIRMF